MTNKLTENLFIELGASLASAHPVRNIIVQKSAGVIDEHRQKYNNTDVFTTVFQYDSSDIRNANQQGSLYFDLDGQTAQDDAKTLASFLMEKGCPEQSIHLFFSGNKGFHIEVAFTALGIQPDKILNKVFGNIAKELKEKNNLSSVDIAIYDQVRLWRLSNSINSKSGLFKIPLSLKELDLSLEAIKELAKSPRSDFTYGEPKVWTEFAAIFERAKTLQIQVYEAKEPLQLQNAVGVQQGSRDDEMLKLACSLLRRNYNEPEVWDTITQINQTYKPPLDDKSMTRIFKQAVRYTANDKSHATTANTYRGTDEMSQVANEYGIPDPILLSDLSSETMSVSWIWEGFLARGHKTLLAALFKAGKSTFIGLLLKSLESGTDFLGQRTIPCNVLVLTEESRSQWVERRDELNLQSQIYILSNPLKYKLSYLDWVSWLAGIKDFCKEKEIELVIIDTVSEFWSVNDENKAPEVTSALMPLNYLTEDNVAVLLVHHFRKSGGTQGTAARGSGALASKVDIMIDFTRYEDNELATKRRLSCLSRFEETPREIVIDYVNNDYIILGSSAEVKNNEKLADILSIFSAYPDGFTVRDVWENWDSFENGKKPSVRTLQRHIVSLIASNKISKVEDRKLNGKLVPFYKLIKSQNHDLTHDKTPNGIGASQNVAGDSKTELVTKERELFEKLQTTDKKSQEYAQIHKDWMLLRIEGEKQGLFFSIIPVENEPWQTKSE